MLFAPAQNVVLPGQKVGVRVCHHKAYSASGVRHIFIVGRIGLGHHLAAHQHVGRLQDGIAEILVDATDRKGKTTRIIELDDLADGVFIPEMGIGKLLAYHTAVPGNAPVSLVALHQVIAEHLKKGTVGRHSATIYPFPVNGKGGGGGHIGHAATLFNFRKIVFQVLIQPIAHRNVILIGNHVDPVGVLLKGISRQLPLDIHRQQEHEGHRHRQSHEVDSPV